MPKRAKEPFAWSNDDGTITVVSSDDVYADDHPYVKFRPDMFGDVADERVIGKPSAIVEQATAAPGEKRATTKP